MVGAGVSGIATIATLLIATRSLSSEGAGQFFVAISLFAIVQGLRSLGVETGLQYFIPISTPASARCLIAVVTFGAAVLGLVTAAVVFVVAGPLGGMLSGGETSSESASSMIRLIAIMLPFAGLY